jgi:hypothetical protein
LLDIDYASPYTEVRYMRRSTIPSFIRCSLKGMVIGVTVDVGGGFSAVAPCGRDLTSIENHSSDKLRYCAVGTLNFSVEEGAMTASGFQSEASMDEEFGKVSTSC